MNEGTGQKPPGSALSVSPGVAGGGGPRPPKPRKRREYTVDEHIRGLKAGDRTVIGRTFSLIESASPRHREKAEELLRRIMPDTGGAIRLGISGVPGAGKSTFIEALGKMLIGRGLKVAVLTIDPSSDVSGGSILGDKTRMETLGRSPQALVRPSACGPWRGGVARGTRESILVCEAAGYDVVIVETVGVGQSETQVASMVDMFLLLMLTGGGDELQGIKRGILEVAELIAVNKADGANVQAAKVARTQIKAAMQLLRSRTEGWSTPVVTCSSITGDGVPEIWELVERHRSLLVETGMLDQRRRDQAGYWLRQTVEHQLLAAFYRSARIKQVFAEVEGKVLEGRLSPFAAADELLELSGLLDGRGLGDGGA